MMTLRTLRRLGMLAVATLALVPAAQARGAERTVLIGGHVVMPDGSLAENRAIVIEDGRIARIAPASEFADDADARRYPNAVISPGLIDLDAETGVQGQDMENIAAIDPDAAILESVDPYADDLDRALRHGVTAAMLLPGDRNLVPGGGATIRTWSPDGRIEALNPFGPLSVVLSSMTWRNDREPTARAGALAMLRRALRAASEEESGRLHEALSREIGLLVTCETGQDVVSALTIFGQHGRTPMIRHTIDAGDVAEDLAAEGAMVVVGPYSFDGDWKTLSGAAAAEAAGADVAFSGRSGSTDPDQMRVTAALAVRHGMTPEAARRGMTASAAKVAGVADRIGALEKGRDADIVIFSRDPLRLDARVLEVWIEGRRVHASQSEQFDPNEEIGATYEN